MLGLWLDSMILKVLSNLNDSKILRFFKIMLWSYHLLANQLERVVVVYDLNEPVLQNGRAAYED